MIRLASTTLLILLLGAVAWQVHAAEQHRVQMKGKAFTPPRLTIQVGDTVTWTNDDDRDHTVVSDGFRSGNLKPGQSFSHTFQKAGTFGYSCTYYPRMKGSIVVQGD